HLFADNGYAAGYYVYMWAEVLDADGFEAFEASGDVFNADLAAKFKRFVLSAGNTLDPAEAYRAFRGRDPDVGALLRGRGLS
ncbi:MAG TPA: M3 family metallopeptidase, partial [Spirochaetales bacterium]|nr:M3 family metallopeptidase [Spirochaetales bacterium]